MSKYVLYLNMYLYLYLRYIYLFFRYSVPGVEHARCASSRDTRSVQAAYAQFQKDIPTAAVSGREIDTGDAGTGDAGETSLQARQVAAMQLGRGYALGTLILLAIVISAAVVSHQTLTSFSTDVALTNDAATLIAYASNAMLLLRSLHVRSCARPLCLDLWRKRDLRARVVTPLTHSHTRIRRYSETRPRGRRRRRRRWRPRAHPRFTCRRTGPPRRRACSGPSRTLASWRRGARPLRR